LIEVLNLKYLPKIEYFFGIFHAAHCAQLYQLRFVFTKISNWTPFGFLLQKATKCEHIFRADKSIVETTHHHCLFLKIVCPIETSLSKENFLKTRKLIRYSRISAFFAE